MWKQDEDLRYLLVDGKIWGVDLKTLRDRDLNDLLPNFFIVNHVSMLINSQSYIIDYIIHAFPVRTPKHVPPRDQNCDSLLTYATN